MHINLQRLGSMAFDADTITFQHALWRQYVEKKPRDDGLTVIPGIADDGLPLAQKVVFFHQDAAPHHRAVTRMIQEEMIDQHDPIQAFDSLPQHPHYLPLVAESHALLRAVAPSAAFGVNTFIQQLILLHCPDFVAASSARFLGTVVMAPKPDWHVIDYLENLVHEASHIDLFIRQLIDPLVRSKTLLKSPLRTLPRPAIGVFHAAFVLCRTSTILYQLLTLDRYAEKAREHLVISLSQLATAIAALQAAECTPLGQRILADIVSTSHALLIPPHRCRP